MQLCPPRSRNSPSAVSNPRSRSSQAYVHIVRCIPTTPRWRSLTGPSCLRRAFRERWASTGAKLLQSERIDAIDSPRILVEERGLLRLG